VKVAARQASTTPLVQVVRQSTSLCTEARPWTQVGMQAEVRRAATTSLVQAALHSTSWGAVARPWKQALPTADRR
jgi:hypothetical protein